MHSLLQGPRRSRSNATMTGLALVVAMTLAGVAFGHAGHGKESQGHHHHDDDDAKAPTQEQIDKRLARVVKRALVRKKQRAQRQRDRKRALGKRLWRRLGGAPLTPAIEKELTLHAERVAKLRHIRYLAAVEKDYPSVEAVDLLLAKENARHEEWWRSTVRLGKGDAKKEAKP